MPKACAVVTLIVLSLEEKEVCWRHGDDDSNDDNNSNDDDDNDFDWHNCHLIQLSPSL